MVVIFSRSQDFKENISHFELSLYFSLFAIGIV